MPCRLIVLALLLSASLSVSAQSSQTGTITGRVVNESGQPLPNARVTVQAIGSLERSQDAITDREGKFQISDLDPLSYRVFAGLSTYTTLTDLDAWSTSYRVGDSVKVVLTKGGVITGTVTTQTGEPVIGVRVFARRINTESSHVSGFLSPYPMERKTDDRGVYRIYGLATGTYVVWAGGSSGWSLEADAFDSDVPTYSPASTRDTAGEISVRAGQETTNVDITYRGEPGRIVSGSARRSETGEPAQIGISLIAVGKSKSEWNLSTSQEPGSKGFMFRGVDDGDYDVMAVDVSERTIGNCQQTNKGQRRGCYGYRAGRSAVGFGEWTSRA